MYRNARIKTYVKYNSLSKTYHICTAIVLDEGKKASNPFRIITQPGSANKSTEDSFEVHRSS